MNIKKLQVGTKVKILHSPYEEQEIKVGAIGYVVVGSTYHKRGKVLDQDGDVWVVFSKHVVPEFSRHCFNLKDIRVLRYQPKEVSI